MGASTNFSTVVYQVSTSNRVLFVNKIICSYCYQDLWNCKILFSTVTMLGIVPSPNFLLFGSILLGKTACDR